jgi:hypothetical protein
VIKNGSFTILRQKASSRSLALGTSLQHSQIFACDLNWNSSVYRNRAETYCLSDKGATLLDPDQNEVTIVSEHSMIFDVFPMKDRVSRTPAQADRYRRSFHEYHYPTEFRRGRLEYDPLCMGAVSIAKDDIAKYISASNEEKRRISFSENILAVR